MNYAFNEVGLVRAAQPDPLDGSKRFGYMRLKRYFDTAAKGVYSASDITDRKGNLKDWCGIFALWAIKTGGVDWVGMWKDGSGISSVERFEQTSLPEPGDVGCLVEYNHFNLIYSVSSDGIKTIDGNSYTKEMGNGLITGPSGLKPSSSFDAGFYTAFPSPLGKWKVKVGQWTWYYEFHKNGNAIWKDIEQPPRRKGTGKWQKSGAHMTITWDTGAVERWDLPLKVKQGEAQLGELVGQGRIIAASRIEKYWS